MMTCSHSLTLGSRCAREATVRIRRDGQKSRCVCDSCLASIQKHNAGREKIRVERIIRTIRPCVVCGQQAPNGRETCSKSCASVLSNRHRKFARNETDTFIWHPILDKFIYGPVTP